MFFHESSAPVVTVWVTDTRTKKEYQVLERWTSTLDHDTNQNKCKMIGGHLPEPKDLQEHLFVDSLNATRFLLGIKRNGAGQWLYESDGSPPSPDWLSWYNGREGNGNCVSYVHHRGVRINLFHPELWFNTECESNNPIPATPKSLICQKVIGE